MACLLRSSSSSVAASLSDRHIRPVAAPHAADVVLAAGDGHPSLVVASTSNKIRRRRRRRPSAVPSAAIISRGGGDSPSPSPSKKSSDAVEGLKNSLASALASLCAKSLLQPFDTIKSVQQHHQGRPLSFLAAARTITTRPGGAGPLELYAGLAASAIGSMPSIGIYYGVYSYGKRVLIPHFQERYGSKRSDKDRRAPIMSDNALKLGAVAISAAMGNAAASAFRVPYEVVKQKLQTGQYTGTMTCLSAMFKADGVRAFFPSGGVAIQMLRDIPYAVFTLMAYEMLRDSYVTQAETTSPVRDMIAGATAGGFGTFMTNGLDVIKTRLQIEPELYGGSVRRCTQMALEEAGPAVFMRGMVPRLMHKIPANGFFFVFFEFYRRLLRCEGAHDVKGASADEKR